MSYRGSSRYRTQKSPDWRFLFVLRVIIFLAFLVFGLGIIFWEYLPMSQYYDLTMQRNYRYALGVLIVVYGFYRLAINLPKRNTHQDDEE